MPTNAENPDELGESTREALVKARDLLDEMKIVQEHENAILQDDGSPLLTTDR